MGSYALSGKADEDVENIARTTIRLWGPTQAECYLLGLHAAFQRLAEFPDLGRDAANIRAGYRRLETGSHVIFYRQFVQGVVIIRVLHKRMDLERHL